MNEYEKWVGEKAKPIDVHGIDGADPADHLFPHQKDLIRWALSRGRSAIFADTGLGKGPMLLDWARVVSEKGRVLILAPLAVAQQLAREAKRFGSPGEYVRADNGSQVVITNYEMLDRFDPTAFEGVVLDESSILKSFTGATRNAIIDAFQQTPYRLACTATPAPNDYTELGNHSEFLGIKTRVEMLAEYFAHDGGSTHDWRLKGHAEESFWRWVCSWAAVVRRPSDLGYEDGAYALPPLRMHEHVIAADHRSAWSEGLLFAPTASTLSDQRAVRRMTRSERAKKATELSTGSDPVLIWCELNAEGDDVTAAIPDAVQISGADSLDAKEARLLGFIDGTHRVLVTKPSMAGFGLNLQHCARQIFVGASHSYEGTYQAIRRSWRYGQTRPVDVHVIRAEVEDSISANYRRKEADAERLQDMLVSYAKQYQNVSSAAVKEWNEYDPKVNMIVPSWAERSGG